MSYRLVSIHYILQEGNVLWLRAELEDIIIFPKEDGRFDLKNDARYGALIVEGPFSEMESSSSRDDVTTSRDSSNWAHGASKRRRVSDPHRQTIIDELENLRSASQDITLKVSSLITLLHGDTAYPQDQADSL